MLPIVIFLICIGWRILKRRKQEEKEDNDLMIKTRPIDPDESMRINSDDESIPYKKDMSEDSPEPTEPLRVDVVDNDIGIPYPPYDPHLTDQAQGRQWVGDNEPQPADQARARQWTGETEIN